jgi:hypothetical protein
VTAKSGAGGALTMSVIAVVCVVEELVPLTVSE